MTFFYLLNNGTKSVQVVQIVIMISDLLNMTIIDTYILLLSMGISIHKLFDIPPRKGKFLLQV